MVCQDMTNADLRGNPHPRLHEGNGRMGAAGALLRCAAFVCAACAWTGLGAPVPPAALPGNHPDPSICRVGNAYYLVTSSNKWYPGLPVYRSENLRDWTCVGHAASGHDWGRLPASSYCEWGLTDNFGLWAPTIRWHDGTFYIVCTLLDAGPRRPGHHNFIVTAKDPAGPWSAPMWIDGGYDPSLFFDDDGKVYLITVGINMAEFDLATGQTKGPFRQIAKGLTETSVAVEAPHLYKMKGRYLLILAEGGTERGHCTAAFVSDDVWGPYRACSHNPVITARGQGERVTVRNKGHADLVETPEGDLYAVFLGVRGEVGKPDYPFGRETFLCRASFDGENLRFDDENLLAGAYVDSKTYYRTPAENCHLRRLTSLVDAETLEVASAPDIAREGVVFANSSRAYCMLLKTADAIELVWRCGERKGTLAKIPYAEKTAVLRLVFDHGTIRFFYGPSAKALKAIDKTVDFESLRRVGLYFNGPGIGTVRERNWPAE